MFIMDMIQRGTEIQSDWLERYASRSVVYKAGGTGVVLELNAIVGKTAYKEVDQYGFQIDTSCVDFIVKRSDVSFDPSIGDTITIDDRVHTVLSIPGKNCWEWSGQPGIRMRIHTKLTEEALL